MTGAHTMADDTPDDRPWNEEEWEQLMRQSDVRSAKFGELLETLHEDPNRDAIIAHEMGWDRREEDEEGDEDEEEDEDQSDFEMPVLDDMDLDEDWEETARLHHEALDAIPAYSRGCEWGLRVHKTLQKYLDGDEELEPDDPLVEAFSSSLVVAAKIAGGHGMGYDDDVLCGNIVCCKRALEASARSVAALEELLRLGTVPKETIEPLLDEGRAIHLLVEQHIAELRSRVWWV